MVRRTLAAAVLLLLSLVPVLAASATPGPSTGLIGLVKQPEGGMCAADDPVRRRRGERAPSSRVPARGPTGPVRMPTATSGSAWLRAISRPCAGLGRVLDHPLRGRAEAGLRPGDDHGLRLRRSPLTQTGAAIAGSGLPQMLAWA